MTVGQRVKEERERLQMTQTQFGELCGVKKLAQIRFEKDVHIPGGSYLIEAARLGCDVQYLLTGLRSPNFTQAEKVLVEKYRTLSEEDQREAQTMAAKKNAAANTYDKREQVKRNAEVVSLAKAGRKKSEIASEVNLSRERVRQIIAKDLRKKREA